jgi:uncharacterized phage infection (PIP) family protein YhgE
MKLTSAAAILVLLLTAGCGGSDSSFTDGYNKAVKPLSEIGKGMGSQPREFERLARRTKQTRNNLAKLDPPDDAKDEFKRLLSRLDEVTDDLDAVATAARSNDVVKQREAAERLVRSSTQVQQAETALKQAVEG